MTKISETGHANNVANFESLISFANGYGTAYNPSKSSLVISALQALLRQAQSSLEQVNSALADNGNAVASREVAFKPLSKLMTRVMNAARSSDIPHAMLNDIQAVIRKIQGGRATPKRTEEEKAAQQAEGNGVKEISSSQMSFDSRMANLDKLIKLLAAIPAYAPNEEELKVASLQLLLDHLRGLDTGVVNSTTQLSNARISRNQLLYLPETGLVGVALSVKVYIKAVFGATSPQYKQVSGLVFRNGH